MSQLPTLETLWLHSAHPSTRSRPRSPSPPRAGPSRAGQGPSSEAHDVSEQLVLSARLVRQSTRGDHLPARGAGAERAARMRALLGYPALGSAAEADQLSDLEESVEVGREHMVRFGEKYIVQIGRRRTLHEEDLSQEEDEVRRAGAGAMSEIDMAQDDQDNADDPEGGPGNFVGGHTGHAQAELARQQMAEAERRVRQAEAEATRAAAAAAAARSQAERQAAMQEDEDAVDLDADVEDMDDDGVDLE